MRRVQKLDMSELRRNIEQILADAYQASDARNILIVAMGGSAFIEQVMLKEPEAHIHAWFMDHWAYAQAVRVWGAEPRVHLSCDVDLPQVEVDRVLMATRKDGDGELTRELTLQSLSRLVPRGELWVSTNNPRDTWLLEELRRWSKGVSIRPQPEGRVYVLTRPERFPQEKSFEAQVVFRDQERLIQLRTRPGVFAHRKIDSGARALLETATVEAGEHVLDFGCGSGAVGVALACRENGIRLTAVDSNPRAVQATKWACDANGIADYDVRLSGSGLPAGVELCDIALTNPPYFSKHRISQVMVEACLSGLKPQGRLFVVTKDPEWYLQFLAAHVASLELHQARGYQVVSAVMD